MEQAVTLMTDWARPHVAAFAGATMEVVRLPGRGSARARKAGAGGDDGGAGGDGAAPGGSRRAKPPREVLQLVDALRQLGCAVDCLPPHQFFSICTTNSGVLLFDSTTEPQKYGATWEAYLPRNPCASTPWRVWQLEQVPTPDLPGAWADPSIESDCSPYPKKNAGPLPTGRFYYKVVAEVKKAVAQ